jgi:hypothetical protein
MKSFNNKYTLNTIGKTQYCIIDDFLELNHWQSINDKVDWLKKRNYFSFKSHIDWDALLLKGDIEEFKIFHSNEFKDFVTTIFPYVKITNDVLSELHYHEVYSPSSWIHNDYEVVNFKRDPLPNNINLFNGQVDYRMADQSDNVYKRVRAIVIIYYINETPWLQGHGGETAFYLNDVKDYEVEKYEKTVAPLANRALIYEINPWSQHAFLSNLVYKRINLIQWYHTTIEYMNELYKKSGIVL